MCHFFFMYNSFHAVFERSIRLYLTYRICSMTTPQIPGYRNVRPNIFSHSSRRTFWTVWSEVLLRPGRLPVTLRHCNHRTVPAGESKIGFTHYTELQKTQNISSDLPSVRVNINDKISDSSSTSLRWTLQGLLLSKMAKSLLCPFIPQQYINNYKIFEH